jgi:hypothetical protein
MKVLFVIRSIDYFHYYRTIIESLCKRGHQVDLLFDEGWSKGANRAPLEQALQQYPQLSWGWSQRRKGVWRTILFTTREVRTYRRFLLATDQSVYYRDRWLRYLPWFVRGAIKYIPGVKSIIALQTSETFLSWIEDITPASSNVLEEVKKRSPKLIVATPLNQRFAEELEYLKAARQLKIPSAGSVLSWDNLTTKGLIHVWPDVLMVWNETQVKEAHDHHGIPRERTRIIGAPVFDVWFSELKPSTTREEFCKKHGLDPARPYLLYLGSSRNISHDEAWVVKKVREALDVSDKQALRQMQIVIRPHGANSKTYEGIERKGIIVVPKMGTLPSTEESLQLSYDSMYFSQAIIGVNTSAMIEAMIVGKPVIAMMLDVYAKTQTEAQHFRQLLGEHALELVHSDEELRKVAACLMDGEDKTKPMREQFIQKYIRPYGLSTSAGERAAEALEMV